MQLRAFVPWFRATVNRLLPNALLPYVRKLDQRVQNRVLRAAFYRNTYDTLSALKCKVAYNKYGGYCVPLASKHRDASSAVLANLVHEPDTIEFMAAHCGAGDIVHAGVYFGDFLPALSAAVGEGNCIWCFEPNYENFRCAQITVLINDLRNVRLYNQGLGVQSGSAQMEVADGHGLAHGGGSSFVPTVTGRSTSQMLQPAELVRLDDAIPEDRQVSIVQLDVEGYEEWALKGAIATIRRCRPILILEMWPGSQLLSGTWFVETLGTMGYRRIDTVHENAVLACS